MKIAITGHRPNKLGNDYNLTSPLILSIKQQIIDTLDEQKFKGGVDINNLTLITGMALGIDTLFAKIAIENNIPFIAAIPCAGQSSMWPAKSKQIYQDIVNHPLCTKEWISTLPYSPQLMQQRNKWMVDNCDLLIAVWDGTSGGTANCIKYANSINREIVRINPSILVNTV